MHAEVFLKVTNSADTIMEMAKQVKKPVIPVLSCFLENDLEAERVRIATFNALRKAEFPVYPTIQEALYVIETYLEWAEKRERRGAKDTT